MRWCGTVPICTPIFHLVTERASAGFEIASGQMPSSDALREECSLLPVCVVIPAHNRAHQLPRCLASVWAQHPRGPKEVIVVDDHSTDDTAAVAASLGARVIRHRENRGAAAARNTAIAAADCEWLAFLDSDDEWLPNHLAHLWEIKGEHALVGGAAYYCTSDGIGDRFSGPVSRTPMQFHSPDRLISTLNFFTTSGSMLRRDVALAVGGFGDWWGVQDFDLWVRVAGAIYRHVFATRHRALLRSRASRYHGPRNGCSPSTVKWSRPTLRGPATHRGCSSAGRRRWSGTPSRRDGRKALGGGDAARARPHCKPATPDRSGLAAVVEVPHAPAHIATGARRRAVGRTSAVPERDERRAVLDVLRDRPVHDLSSLSPRRHGHSAAPSGGRGCHGEQATSGTPSPHGERHAWRGRRRRRDVSARGARRMTRARRQTSGGSRTAARQQEALPRQKVLMFAYYFPPLGGSGVQRTLKYVKYLPDHGFEPLVDHRTATLVFAGRRRVAAARDSAKRARGSKLRRFRSTTSRARSTASCAASESPAGWSGVRCGPIHS